MNNRGWEELDDQYLFFGVALNDKEWTSRLIDNYPTCKEYLLNRYWNQQMNYQYSDFRQLFNSLVIKYGNLLDNIETAIKLRKETPISKENLGTVLQTDNNVEMNTDTDKSDSYQGYEVLGEFQVRKSDTIQLTKSKRNEQNLSYTYNLTQLEQLKVKYNWDEFEKELLKLFITKRIWNWEV